LQVRHGVGQVLEKLGLCLQELLHSGIHCAGWGALPGRFTAGWSTPDIDLVFTI
jgi:hypothetical protein